LLARSIACGRAARVERGLAGVPAGGELLERASHRISWRCPGCPMRVFAVTVITSYWALFW
jgi:hypothetical protein